MPKTVADINPALLKWARIRARYDPELLANKLGVSVERYTKWETGDLKPSLRQLYNLTRRLGQPLQTFFLREPPSEPEILAEMRRLPGSQLGKESPTFTAQVRLVSERREIALKLFGDLAEPAPSPSFSLSLQDDPENAAIRIREALNVSITKQVSWGDYFQAFRAWRTALETIGVLVFQIPDVEIDEMRGFSLFFHPLPIIATNIQDYISARVFTLFHEFAHILLRESVLDSGGKNWYSLASSFKVEQFCNEVAGATLIPLDDFYTEVNNLGKGKHDTWEEDEIEPLANRYHVSRSVVVRRLRTFQLISDNSFQELVEIFDNYVPPASKSGGTFYAKHLARMGNLIPTLAFHAYYGDRLTTSDLSLILGLKAEHLGKLEQRVLGFSYGFEGGSEQ